MSVPDTTEMEVTVIYEENGGGSISYRYPVCEAVLFRFPTPEHSNLFLADTFLAHVVSSDFFSVQCNGSEVSGVSPEYADYSLRVFLRRGSRTCLCSEFEHAICF